MRPEPPPRWSEDDEHPLACNYRLMFNFTLGEAWLEHRFAPLALHLLQREADEEMPEEPST